MLPFPPINTPPNFLISSHHITFHSPPHYPPYESRSSLFLVFILVYFSSFFSLYFGVKRGQFWGKKMIGEQPSWGKTKLI